MVVVTSTVDSAAEIGVMVTRMNLLATETPCVTVVKVVEGLVD